MYPLRTERLRSESDVQATAGKISKRMVDALSAHGRPDVYWDRDLPGFGVRLYPTGRKTYVVQSRGPTGSRRVTVGQHGDISAEQARKAAAGIIDRIKAGENPTPERPEPVAEPTVADLAERYSQTHVAVQCKASSMRRYRQLLQHHILPALGEMPVGSVGRKHVAALHYALRDRPGTANPVLWVLSKMFSLADAWGLRPAGLNPCRTRAPVQDLSPGSIFEQGGVPTDRPGVMRGRREGLGVAAGGGGVGRTVSQGARRRALQGEYRALCSLGARQVCPARVRRACGRRRGARAGLGAAQSAAPCAFRGESRRQYAVGDVHYGGDVGGRSGGD